ncbi:mitochondrial assembly of ribosomal large subunit protein 1 [Diceros bicornis minor]|uniref:mitochondrial assembly of ribosomal large subunit protein 1 n=1 Tax=Diceros bicornis minor TaxID=77932 RepID=UPI0026F20D41|nr:mitochondrial assembly of ribosomal large subunit protein 1 [Diceros bicornis minor]
MGPGRCVARRLGTLLWRRALFPGAGLAASAGPRLQLLAVGRFPTGPGLGQACLAPDRARGLHGGPGVEELAERAAGEGRPESGTADHTGPKFDIDMLVSLLRQENARDICVIKVPPEMKYTDYFVIGSGTSTRHLHAMAYYIVKMYKYLKCKSEPHVKIEGKDTDDWLCVDFGNMVIHLMLPEARETYELEKLWTLRSYDDQLAQIAPETLPEDFILGIEDDTSSLTPVEVKYE